MLSQPMSLKASFLALGDPEKKITNDTNERMAQMDGQETTEVMEVLALGDPRFACFNTEWGWVAVMSRFAEHEGRLGGSPAGLCRTILPAPDERSAINAITRGVNAIRQEAAFTAVKHALVDYFKGEQVEFPFAIDLDFEGCTCFQRDVWEVTRSISYGQLRSYGWIAARMGRPKAARAVGQALGANRLPIVIPCHRVVRSDGSLGGFSGGLHWKKKLIELERAVCRPLLL